MQTICTSLQTENHTNTSSLNFYRPDALFDAQPTVSKHYRVNPTHRPNQSIVILANCYGILVCYGRLVAIDRIAAAPSEYS